MSGVKPAHVDVESIVRSKPHLDAIVIHCLTDLGLPPEKRGPVALAVLDAYASGLNDALAPIQELLLNSGE